MPACSPPSGSSMVRRSGPEAKVSAHDLRVVCFSTALRRLNEQEWMLPSHSPSKSSIERWSRQLLKMPIGYVAYFTSVTITSFHIWASDHTWVMRPDRLVSIPVFDGEPHGAIFRYPLSLPFPTFGRKSSPMLAPLRRCVDGWPCRPCMVGDLRGRKMRTGSKIENPSTT